MEKLGEGWQVFVGVSDSKITNGLWSEDYAAEKLPDLEVVVHEVAPNGQCCIHKSPVCVPAQTEDPIGDTSGGCSIPRQDTIRCQYMGGTNTIVPCIHIGEQVWVLHYEGGDMWYWLPMGRHRDAGIRQHEHIRWYAMNRCKSVIGCNTFKPVNDDETYFVDINTNPGDKMVQVHTARNDGEFCQYDIFIYPELGKVRIHDDIGNELTLDSKQTIWYMKNADMSYLELNKEDITLSCTRDMNIHCGRDMTMTVGNNQSITVVKDRTDSVQGKRQTVITLNDERTVNGSAIDNITKNWIKKITGSDSTTVVSHYLLKTSDYALTSSGTASIMGSVMIGGDSFVVGSSHGVVPVVIVFGSNAW